MSQLATSVGRVESQGKLSWHTENNMKHNVCAISLRNGKIYEDLRKSELEEEAEEESKIVLGDREAENVEEKDTSKQPKPNRKEYMPIPAFPWWLRSAKFEREDEEILDTFRKVEVNIPSLEVIKQVPRYAKFLKDLCVAKKIEN